MANGQSFAAFNDLATPTESTHRLSDLRMSAGHTSNPNHGLVDHAEVNGERSFQELTIGSDTVTKDQSNHASAASDGTSSHVQTTATVGKSPKGRQERVRHKNLDKDSLVCGVCSDKGSGFHFGAITCESCKAFFRRRAQKGAEQPCAFTNNCKMDPDNRKFCVDCRLKKCLKIGMKKELILDDETRAKRKKPTRKASASGASNSSAADSKKSAANLSPSRIEDKPPQPLTEEQKQEIECILQRHSALVDTGCAPTGSAPTETGDVKEMANSKLYRADDVEFDQLTNDPQHVAQLVNMMGGFVIRFISFFKELHAYPQLDTHDRIAIIKSTIMETMAIRSAIQYNPNVPGFEVQNSNSGAKKNIQLEFIKAIFGEQLYKAHMDFILSINMAAEWDKPTLILTMLINLFASDIPAANKAVIQEAETHYTQLLEAYIRSLYSQGKADEIYPRVLMKLVDVRTYRKQANDSFERLSVATSDGLEPLLKELLSAS